MIVHDGSMLIKDEIKLKARFKIKELEKETDAKIDEMNADTDLRLKKIKDDILQDAGKKADAERKKIDAQTNVEMNRMLLDAREEVISDVVSVAMNELESNGPLKFKDELRRLLTMGTIECSTTDKLMILGNKGTLDVFDRKYLDAVKKEAGRDVRFEKEVRKMGAGIVLWDEGNDMFLDYSFDGIFKSKEDEIRTGVSKILFD